MTDCRRDLLFLLHDLARLLRVEVDRRARAHGTTRAQWAILFWLDRRPGLSQKELADLLEVEPITVARLVDRLEARGLVERRPDPADRRIWRLHLLQAAGPILAEIGEERADMLEVIAADLDEAERAALAETLLKMKTALLAARRAEAKDVKEVA